MQTASGVSFFLTSLRPSSPWLPVPLSGVDSESETFCRIPTLLRDSAAVAAPALDTKSRFLSAVLAPLSLFCVPLRLCVVNADTLDWLPDGVFLATGVFSLSCPEPGLFL